MTTSGSVDKSQVIVREQIPARTAASPKFATVLNVAKSKAFVIRGSDLFVWEIPLSENVKGEFVEPLAFVPEQSSLILNGKATTELKHTIRGAYVQIDEASSQGHQFYE